MPAKLTRAHRISERVPRALICVEVAEINDCIVLRNGHLAYKVVIAGSNAKMVILANEFDDQAMIDQYHKKTKNGYEKQNQYVDTALQIQSEMAGYRKKY